MLPIHRKINSPVSKGNHDNAMSKLPAWFRSVKKN